MYGRHKTRCYNARCYVVPVPRLLLQVPHSSRDVAVPTELLTVGHAVLFFVSDVSVVTNIGNCSRVSDISVSGALTFPGRAGRDALSCIHIVCIANPYYDLPASHSFQRAVVPCGRVCRASCGRRVVGLRHRSIGVPCGDLCAPPAGVSLNPRTYTDKRDGVQCDRRCCFRCIFARRTSVPQACRLIISFERHIRRRF